MNLSIRNFTAFKQWVQRAARQILLAALLLTAVSATGYAQEEAVYGPQENSWALQFQIARDFTLTNFAGSLLTLKLHTSPVSAWRISGSYSFDYYKGYTASLIRFGYMHYFFSEDRLHGFAGTGPTLSYNCKYLSYNYTNGSKGNQSMYDATPGVFLLIGAEWFVAEQISFTGEYTSTLGYNTYKSEHVDNAPDGTVVGSMIDKHNGWQFSNEAVRAGISVYF